MPTYSTPGVYVTESSLTSLIPSVSGPTSAVFFGTAPRGPVVPTLINDWPTFKTIYGDLDNAYDLCYSVYHYFTNGGRSCYVNRVIGAGSTTATKVSVPFFPTGVGGASPSLFTATAEGPGTWGNNLAITFTAGNVAASATVKPTFNLSITLAGVEVEKWTELSPNENANRYFMEVLNRYSKYVGVSAPHAFTSSLSSASAGTLYYTSAPVTLAGGTTITEGPTDYVTALDNVDAINGNLLLNAVAQTAPAVVTGLLAKCAARGDSFAIIDGNQSDLTFAQIQSTSNSYASLANAGYGAVFAPCLEMIDPAKTGPNAIRTTSPGGAVAGLFVRTELSRNVSKAPAGYAADIRGALGLTVKLTDTQVGTLYDGGGQTNCFKAVPGAGIIINGTRTLEKISPDKFIPIRRTLNYLKFSIKELSSASVFESNDAVLWNSLTASISSFLYNFWKTGALKGARSSDAYFVVCDATNNTPTSIDQGIVNVSIGVALSYPAEFIVINISQWTGGSNAVESI